LGGLDRFELGLELARREIPRHYSKDDLDADITYGVVGSNTSPLSNLAHPWGRLDLLPGNQFGAVLVPPRGPAGN